MPAAVAWQRREVCARLSEGTSTSWLGTDPSSCSPWGSTCAPGRDDRSRAHCPEAASGWPAGPIPQMCPQAGARSRKGSDTQLKPCHYQPQAVLSCACAGPDLELWGLRDPTDAHSPGKQPGPSPSLLPIWLGPAPTPPGRQRGEAAPTLRDGAAPPASSPLSQALPEVQKPERGILRGPGYCWGNPQPRLKPHTKGLPCLLSSGPQSSSATASLEHCPLRAAVSVLPRWDSMAHGVKMRIWPVMALLTSSVGPEVPGPAPQLGLAAESRKEGISDGRRSAAEGGFQPSQRPAPRAAEQALPSAGLCAQAVGKRSPRNRTPSARQLGLCLGTRAGAAGTARCGCQVCRLEHSPCRQRGDKATGVGRSVPPSSRH